MTEKKYREYFLLIGKKPRGIKGPPSYHDQWLYTTWKGWALQRRERFRQLGRKSEIYGITRLDNNQILLEVIE